MTRPAITALHAMQLRPGDVIDGGTANELPPGSVLWPLDKRPAGAPSEPSPVWATRSNHPDDHGSRWFNDISSSPKLPEHARYEVLRVGTPLVVGSVVLTERELEAAPIGTVVQGANGQVAQSFIECDGGNELLSWTVTQQGEQLSTDETLRCLVHPVTVLYLPGQ